MYRHYLISQETDNKFVVQKHFSSSVLLRLARFARFPQPSTAATSRRAIVALRARGVLEFRSKRAQSDKGARGGF